MQSNLYVTLSAQRSLQLRMDTLANNIANTSTAGFRAEEVKFNSILSEVSADPVAFSSAGATFLSRASGPVVKTDNPLDVAVQGDAWMAMNTPAGQVYTRDGRMQMTDAGELQTVNGYAVLDAGGAPLVLDPNAGPPSIARDGMISQNGRQVGAIGLFSIDPAARLTRHDNSGVIPSTPATPIADPARVGVIQGFVERSNVNPVTEMSRLITVSRSFEAVSNALSDSEQTLGEAIKTIGG